jgi:hypothetical protein
MAARDRSLIIGARIGERIAREIGEAARERRIALGLSLQVVAGTLGISRTTLARWEAAANQVPTSGRPHVSCACSGSTSPCARFRPAARCATRGMPDSYPGSCY